MTFLLHLLTAGYGTDPKCRDVCIDGESWRVSGPGVGNVRSPRLRYQSVV